jgi:16S rRNA (cytosine1402-N4)-methyltransferase
MLGEVIAALAPKDNGIYIDATFGAGGYTHKILASANCQVIAFDRDPTAIANGTSNPCLKLVHAPFSDMAAHIEIPIDGVVFDLGVSSMQIDQASRGFSFRFDGPLDMRMSASGTTAADLVNSASEQELADLIYLYGEERHARRIAREIVAQRTAAPLASTKQLADLVRKIIPGKRDQIDPATRTFQALRIVVNDELGELETGLAAAEKLLCPGGRLVVVTFHSLEDRIVKAFLRSRSGGDGAPSRHLPAGSSSTVPSFTLLGRKPVDPSAEEIAANPRARSAKLRAAIRTDAPAFEPTRKVAA